jgi:hypothetical protein
MPAQTLQHHRLRLLQRLLQPTTRKYRHTEQSILSDHSCASLPNQLLHADTVLQLR